MAVVGGRSRLHLVDLGSCSRSREDNSLSLTSLGAVITSLLSGQKQVPHRSVNFLVTLLYIDTYMKKISELQEKKKKKVTMHFSLNTQLLK